MTMTRPLPPLGWDQGVRGTDAVDESPDPATVSVALEARVAPVELRPGVTTQAWTYNGAVPGPLIRAHVGDRLIVRFTNSLPEETTIHWHGVRLPANMDGVPDVSQPAVPPGGSFEYSFTLPDAGLFWYHPHVHSTVQVGDGLYGAVLVEEKPDTALPDLGDQTVLVLSDASIQPDGTFTDPTAGGDIATLFGREGNVVLVNGHVQPTLLARPGQRLRWRIVNAARSSYQQLAMAGHTFTQIGTDGGFITAPVALDRVVVIPAGRADVVVTPAGNPGDVLPVRWVAYDRGWGTAFNRPDVDLFYVKLVAGSPFEEPPLPDHLRTIAPLDVTGATPRALELSTVPGDGSLVLGINGVPSWEAKPLVANVGDTEVWTITNSMDFDHPFHLHGFFFQPLDPATGAPPAAPEWRDTFNVPAWTTVQMAVQFDDRRGMWMFHCHILDHADAGMMGMIHVGL